MAGHLLAVVCAWCNRVVVKAPPGADVTHTICPSCVDWTMAHPESRRGFDAPDPEELLPMTGTAPRQFRTV
jgi:hypothetical protein